MIEWFLNYWQEFMGWAAAACITLGLLKKNLKYERILLLTGSGLFIFYSYVIGAWPMLAATLIVSGVMMYSLLLCRQVELDFTLIKLNSDAPATVLKKFLYTYRDDLEKWAPGFNLIHTDGTLASDVHLELVLHQVEIAGLFMYRVVREGEIEILLDYLIPKYRELEAATFVYASQESYFRQKGFYNFSMRSSVPSVQKQILKMGFERSPQDSDFFLRRTPQPALTSEP